MVQQAGCGFACAAGDLDALTENLLRLYRMSAAERAEMGRRGRAYNALHFDRGNLLRQMTDFMLGSDAPAAVD